MGNLSDILEGQDVDGDEIEIDLSGAVEFADLETGKYRFIIRECNPVTSGAGNPCLEWKVSVDMPGHPLHDAYGPISTTPVTGKGAGQTKKFLRALEHPNVLDPSIKLKPKALVGQHFIGTVRKQDPKDDDSFLEFGKLEVDNPDFGKDA